MGFLYRSITFVLIIPLLLYLFAGIIEFGLDWYKNSDISVLHEIRKDKKYDVVIMGTSHARMFGVSGHRAAVSNILQKRIFSLANNGSGPLPQRLYLEKFYRDGNKAETIVYFIDPWVLYSREWNEGNHYITDEVLRLDFLVSLVQSGFDTDVIREYLRKKVSYKLFVFPIPRSLEFNEAMNENNKQNTTNLYPDGINQKNFQRYSAEIERIISIANSHNTSILFIMPPVLMEELPGRLKTVEFLNDVSKKYKVKAYDYTNNITDRSMFLNTDHLNKKGVLFFSQNYLRDAITKNR